MGGREAHKQEHKRVVLIVDDEKPLAQAIAATLDPEGLETALAYDGNQALKLARELQPDLILLDVMLPGKSGFEVCAILKKEPETASIPIIILTAKADLSSRMTGIAAGADEYLTKPFSPTQLIDLVNKILAGQPIEPGPHWPTPSTMSTDQWVIYASELTKLFKQEQSARQDLEQALRRLEEVSQLQREFLGVITHELLTPFGAIGLTMEVLQQQGHDLPSEHRETLDNLTTEIAGLHRMINGVVKFAELMHKQREPELGHYALDRLVPFSVQPVAVLARAREIDFRCLISPNLPKIFADPDLLSEAIFQMTHNAVKFNKPGGQAQVRAFESEKWIVIEVSDTGIGLTPDRLKLLGQPFEQRADSLRRGREGLGVGWAFVGYVAKVHFGRTHVVSPGPDQGSTFTLALPIVTEKENA
ncbi:MAG: response regulator [Chloroflexi bacterium]|nr:response regulator [Chloroflexota bacterium]